MCGNEGAALADGTAVAAFVRDHVERPAPEPEPRRLCAARETEEATGTKAATIRAERRCAADAPDHSRESLRAPYAQPWKWVPCPHACGHVGRPEIHPSIRTD